MGVIALLAKQSRVSPRPEDPKGHNGREMEQKTKKITFIIISIILALVCLLLFFAFVGLGEFSSCDGSYIVDFGGIDE